MATAVLKTRGKLGNRQMNIVDVVIGTYATGGVSVTAAMLGLTILNLVLPSPAAGYVFEYDHDNQKLKAFAAALATYLTTLAYSDIKGSANTDGENADQASEPTNGSAVAAQAAVADAAWTHGALTSPDIGRNVCITIENDSGGSLNLYEGAMAFTVTGKYKGADQEDTITITSSSENKAVANTKFRFKYGVKPFDTVTNITLDNVPDDGLKISTGLGSKVGLPVDLRTPAEADVKKITKNAANLAPTGIVDTTNMTVNLGTLADNDDFTIVYDGLRPVLDLATEVANEANLSGVTVHMLAVGL